LRVSKLWMECSIILSCKILLKFWWKIMFKFMNIILMWLENLNARDHLGDLGIDGRII
jgi:hypothetical protein